MSDHGATQVSGSFEIINSLGLHLRPASQLVHIFAQYPECDVQVGTGETRVNGKSIMGLLMLEASQGSTLHVDCSGPGGEEILQRVGEAVAARFNEE